MNPYDILGISRLAGDDEIKTAYKRKYFEISEGLSEAELFPDKRARLDELNRAYDMIIAEKRSGGTYTNASSFSQYGSGDYTNYAAFYSDIRKKFASGSYAETDMLLDTVPENQRSGEWFFMKAQTCQKLGRLDDAENYISAACSIDPGNSEYRTLYNNIQLKRSGGYQNFGKDTDSSACFGGSLCKWCTALSCIDCCCESTGHDCIPCC